MAEKDRGRDKESFQLLYKPMMRVEDIEIYFKSKIDISYKSELDRLFFFNGNQHRYEEIVEQSIDEFPMPVLREYQKEVAIEFNKEKTGQTLHILDSKNSDAELVGVVMYVRDSVEMITIVHMVLQEECKIILKRSGINIALIIIERLIPIFKMMKGVERIRFYYSGKEIKIR